MIILAVKERLQRRCQQRRGSTSGSRASRAVIGAISAGTACKYQHVDSGWTCWPRKVESLGIRRSTSSPAAIQSSSVRSAIVCLKSCGLGRARSPAPSSPIRADQLSEVVVEIVPGEPASARVEEERWPLRPGPVAVGAGVAPVTEQLSDLLKRHARPEHLGRGGTPQRVRADRRQPRPLARRAPVDVIERDRPGLAGAQPQPQSKSKIA